MTGLSSAVSSQKVDKVPGIERPHEQPRVCGKIVKIRVFRYDPFRVSSDGSIHKFVIVRVATDRLPAV